MFAEAAGADASQSRVNFFVEARYAHQVWEIDVAIEPEALSGPEASEHLRQAFHREHERIFAFQDPASMVEAIAWRAQVSCGVARTAELRLAQTDDAGAAPTKRRVYFASTGWSNVDIHGFSALPAGKTLRGPAIVESPFTSIVVNPGAAFCRSKEGNLVVTPRIQDVAEIQPLRRVV